MIATGDIYLGPELRGSKIAEMLDNAWRAIKSASSSWQEGEPKVVVVWIVPGSLGDVNFTGQRVTLFSRKKKLLQIEAAVPKELVMASPSEVNAFVVNALRQAARTAAGYFAKKKAGTFDLSKADEMIDKVQAALAAK